MSLEEDILINNYLNGQLDKKEENCFVDKLKSDLDFQEKFKLEEQLFNALNENSWSFVEKKTLKFKDYKQLLEEKDLKNLKNILTKVNSNYNSKPNIVKGKPFYYIAAATTTAVVAVAVVAAIGVFFIIQFFFNQNVSNQDLYNDYANLNDLPSFVVRGETDDIDNKLIKAQRLFKSGDYKESLAIFKPILEKTKTNASIYIYIGVAQTELGLYTNARKTFNSLINSDLFDSQIGYWHKALLYIKQDKIEEAKTVLTDIISKSFYNHSKAKELLIELNDE